MKKIDGNGFDIHGSEGQCEIDNVVVAFAYADDTARAGADTGRFDVLNSGHTVVVGVSGDNLRVVLTAGIEVVIDAPDAHLFEFADFVFAHQAQGTANIDPDFGANFFDRFGDFMNFFVRWTAPAVDDAVAHGAGCFSALGAFQELFLREEWIAVDGRLGYGRLRAVVAILRT